MDKQKLAEVIVGSAFLVVGLYVGTAVGKKIWPKL